MTHVFALFFALLAPQAITPATPPPSNLPATQSSQTPATVEPSPVQTAPIEPDASGPNSSVAYYKGDVVTPPMVIYQPAAAFSKEARKKKVSGVATVRLIVDAQGNPEQVQIIKSIADTVDEKHHAAALTLDQAAIDSVKKYKFKPAMFHGKPVATYLNVEVNFQLF